MAKLVLSMDGLVLNEFHLSKPRITIGRRSNNDIQINNLAISGEHAAIVTILNDSFLEDLQSTNGTQVNGRSIKKCVLHHNDEIGFGKYKIKYLIEATPAEKQFEEGMIEMGDIGTSTQFGELSIPTELEHTNTSITPVAADPHPPDAPLPELFSLAEDAPGVHVPTAGKPPLPDFSPPNPFSLTENLPGAEEHAALCILSGSNRGKELPLNKEYVLLGKNGGQVAAVSRELQCYYLSYVEGDPRPLINRQPLGDTPHRLNDGDEIEIAGVHMRFFLKS